MSFPLCPIFWQMLLWLYIAATLAQLAPWWGVWNAEFGIGNSEFRIPHSESVSVIVCARNEAENLRRHLPAILAQQFDSPWELLVVDDASEDDTPAVLQFFQEKNPERLRVLRILEKNHVGKKHALAQGIAAAKYDLLLLTDADCRPASPHWLAQMAATLTAKPETEIVLGYGPMNPTVPAALAAGCENGQNVCVRPGIPATKVAGTYTSWSRYETAFTAAQYFSFALAGMPYMGVGRNLAFRRQVFDRAGGFTAHAHIASGDDDLLVNAAANARNTAICLAPESFVYSDAPPNWAAWLRQKRRHLAASPAYRWEHKIVLGALALSHTGHYLLFFVLLLAGFAPKIVGVFFLLRLFSVWFVFGKILRVLREPGLFWRIPLFDALLAAYYGAVVPWFLLQKKSALWESREK